MRVFNPTHPFVQDILSLLTSVNRAGKTVKFCWIPSHVGIAGNELADAAARRAASAACTRRLPLPARDFYPVASRRATSQSSAGSQQLSLDPVQRPPPQSWHFSTTWSLLEILEVGTVSSSDHQLVRHVSQGGHVPQPSHTLYVRHRLLSGLSRSSPAASQTCRPSAYCSEPHPLASAAGDGRLNTSTVILISIADRSVSDVLGEWARSTRTAPLLMSSVSGRGVRGPLRC